MATTQLLLALAVAGPCLFGPPLEGPVVRSFAPQGAYGGHWGIDIAAPPDTPVKPIAPGVVTFSGQVGGRLSVTVHHGGGLRSSYSYLSSTLVTAGDRVGRGTVIGTSGFDHGIAALHLSLRVGHRYVDPAEMCRALHPLQGLRLAS